PHTRSAVDAARAGALPGPRSPSRRMDLRAPAARRALAAAAEVVAVADGLLVGRCEAPAGPGADRRRLSVGMDPVLARSLRRTARSFPALRGPAPPRPRRPDAAVDLL